MRLSSAIYGRPCADIIDDAARAFVSSHRRSNLSRATSGGMPDISRPRKVLFDFVGAAGGRAAEPVGSLSDGSEDTVVCPLVHRSQEPPTLVHAVQQRDIAEG